MSQMTAEIYLKYILLQFNEMSPYDSFCLYQQNPKITSLSLQAFLFIKQETNFM